MGGGESWKRNYKNVRGWVVCGHARGYYIASAACSSLSCASSSSSTACRSGGAAGGGSQHTGCEKNAIWTRTVFHSARTRWMVHGCMVRHELLVELLLLQLCQLLLELVL